MKDNVHPQNGTLFSTNSKWAVKPWKDMKETWMYITNWKMQYWKGYLHFGSNYMTFKKGKTMDIVKRSVVARNGDRQSIEDFKAVTILVWYHNDEYMPSCIFPNKCCLMLGDFNNGKGCRCVGAESIQKISKSSP